MAQSQAIADCCRRNLLLLSPPCLKVIMALLGCWRRTCSREEEVGFVLAPRVACQKRSALHLCVRLSKFHSFLF